MTITYTGNLKLALPTTGTEAGTWGDVVNQQITALLDQSVSGTVSLTSMTNADYTLTNGNGSSPNEARYMALSVPSTLTLTAARNIIVPTSSKAYIIRNLTTGGFAVTLKTSAGTGISVPNGKTMILYCDGTNVIDGTDYFTSIATGNLSYTGTLTGGTGIVNIGSGQVYKDASGNVGIGTSSPGTKLELNDGSYYMRFAPAAEGSILVNGATGLTLNSSAASTSIRFRIAGDERLRIDASGNLGLGRPTNPNYRMIIRGQGTTSATAGLVVENSVGTEYFYLNDAGNLGIGTSSPGAKLHVDSGASSVIAILNSTNANGGYITGRSSGVAVWDLGTAYQAFNTGTSTDVGLTTRSGFLGFGTVSTERMRLDALGNLLVGTTNANAKITVYGVQANRTLLVRTNSSTATDVPLTAWNDATAGNNVFVDFGTEATYTVRGYIDYNRAGGLVRYNTTSDYRAKDIIGPVQNPGATIDALKVYEGVMKGATQSRPMLIAHEAQAHAPYAVSGTKDDVNEDGTPKYQQIDVSSLVPLLLAEIQSLRKRLAALEAK